MLGFVAECAGHAAAGRLDRGDRQARHQRKGFFDRSHHAKGLLMAMPVQQRLDAIDGPKVQPEATGVDLPGNEFLEQHGRFRQPCAILAGQHRLELVTQR